MGQRIDIYFSSLFDCIQKYACKISGRNSKNCGSHAFCCHVMFDLRILELKTLNAFFSKPCFSNWRARKLKNSLTYFKIFYIGLNCIKFQIESRREKCENKFFIPLFLNKFDEKKLKFCKFCCNFWKNPFFQKTITSLHRGLKNKQKTFNIVRSRINS